MESIKESIYKTKNALADWNIISKNDNNIEIERIQYLILHNQ